MLARSIVPLRLASIVLLCGAIAGMFANSTGPSSARPTASGTSLPAPDPETTASAREAITRTTTSVANRAEVASPVGVSRPAAATSSAELPVAALNAYQRAEQVMASVKPGCHLGWSVLAAIGQVESDHGRSAGGRLQLDGTSTVTVRGALLDGTGSLPRVADTDGGQLDGSSTWDRAVGPMQFLPATWINVRVDGDGDGVRSPDDLDDASLAAAVFLCGWGDDMSSDTGALDALGRYNHSRSYGEMVLSLARTYASGDYSGVTWQYAAAAAWGSTPYEPAAVIAAPAMVESRKKHGGKNAHVATATAHAAVATSGAGPAKGTAAVEPASGASPSPSASPDPSPSPSTDPTPSGSDPAPDPTPSASPTPDDPGLTTVTGVLSSCYSGFCVDGAKLDFGALGADASADFDGDGTTGSRQAELNGLAGQVVTVTTRDGVVTAFEHRGW